MKYRPSLRILENNSITIKDITFYGTTLWFEETVEAGMKREYLNDSDKKDFRYAAGVKSITYLLEGKRGLADLWDEFYKWTTEQ